MIDFHSHILPGIDDGAKDVDETLQMLSAMSKQGITTVVATPHYRGECSVESFLKKRDDSYKKLAEAVSGSQNKYPKIVLGAEVAVGEYLLKLDNPEKLCIEGTSCILTEMPPGLWNPLMYHILYVLSAQHHLKTVIAHVDRYFSLIGKNLNVFKLMDMRPVFQINASCVGGCRFNKLFRLLIENGAEFVLGSDCHDMLYRKPNLDKARRYMERKYGEEILKEIDSFGMNLL